MAVKLLITDILVYELCLGVSSGLRHCVGNRGRLSQHQFIVLNTCFYSHKGFYKESTVEEYQL